MPGDSLGFTQCNNVFIFCYISIVISSYFVLFFFGVERCSFFWIISYSRSGIMLCCFIFFFPESNIVLTILN